MIIPTNRLLCWVVVILPFAALGPVEPVATMACALAFGALLVSAFADAVQARLLARGIRVIMPDIVRLSRNRAGSIPLCVERRDSRIDSILVGLPLPAAIRSEHDELRVLLPAGNRRSTVSWQCTPDARGSFAVNRCYYAVPSMLGFWNARGATDCRSEIRVYPNLLTEKHRLAALFLNRGNFGIHRQRMIGQGREFEELREYMPGDSYDDIHWKGTAKRGWPVTKLYQIERTQEIYVAIDASRLSARKSGDDPALERFITSALVLGLAAEQQKDLFGLITFGSHVTRFINASGGRAHFNLCRDTLYSLEPEIASPDYDELCAFVRLKMRRRALLMVLTDLSDPMLADSFLKNIELICRQHIVVVAMINQPGVAQLFCSADATDVDQIYRKLGGHVIWSGLRQLEKNLGHRGVGFTAVENEKLSSEVVSRYLGVKARQGL